MENTNMRTVLETIGNLTSFGVFTKSVLTVAKAIDLTQVSDDGLLRLARMTHFSASAVATLCETQGREAKYLGEEPIHVELKSTLEELHEKVIIELLNRAVYSM